MTTTTDTDLETVDAFRERARTWLAENFPRAEGGPQLLRAGEEYMEHCREQAAGGAPFGETRERRLTLIEQQCSEMGWRAVELMFRTAGTSVASADAPLGRYFRNLAVIMTHLAMQSDLSGTNAARLQFGLPTLSRN